MTTKRRTIPQIRADVRKAQALLDRVIMCEVEGEDEERQERIRMHVGAALSHTFDTVRYGLSLLDIREDDDHD